METILQAIMPASEEARKKAHQRQESIAKPLGGLGLLEDAIETIAAAQHTEKIDIAKRAVVVFCADNGVVEEGVTQCGQEVTAIVTENLHKGDTTVCIMAEYAKMDVIPVDIGVARPVVGDRILQRAVARSTKNFAKEPAMTLEECKQAIAVGVEIATDCTKQGYRLLATGEMGIGNTTTSAAVASMLLEEDPATMTGRGAGLSSAGLEKKVQTIRQAIAMHQDAKKDPLAILSAVGGLDIAGMVGLYLGAAKAKIPVVMDGAISIVAALLAVRLCPEVKGYLLASHLSAEPLGKRVLEELGCKPLICAQMRLGEGTGAVAAVPLLDMSIAVYQKMVRFEDLQITQYEHLT